MIKITKTNWRPFIELTAVDSAGGEATFYFDVTKRPLIIQQEDTTLLCFDDTAQISVKEKAKDIFKAVDKLIAAEAERKMEEAKRYAEQTMARVAATGKALGEK